MFKNFSKATPDSKPKLVAVGGTEAAAAAAPKPLYYRDAFLDEQLLAYQQEKNISFVTEIDPADFITWVFPKLFRARVPRYKAIADKYGYRVAARDAFAVQSADEFVQLICKALD